MSEFSLSSCLNNPSEAFSAWVDYYYRGNKKDISSSDMGRITAHYSDKIRDWKRIAKEEPDVTKYDLEISDQDYNKWMSEGEDDAKNATGYDNDGHGGKLFKTNALEAASATGSAVIAGMTMKSTVSSVGAIAGHGLEEGTKTFSKEATKKAGEKVGGSGDILATIGLAVASVIAYAASKPNKDQYEAVMEMQDTVLPEAQGQLAAEQDNMATISEDIANAATEAEEDNEEGQNQIDSAKAEYDFYLKTYEALKEKVDSGDALTPEEKELYESVATKLAETGQVIEDTAKDTSDTVTEHYDNIGTYQEGYDEAAETVANVQGQIEYAADIDNSTQTSCNVQAIAQGLNAVSAGTAAAKAGIKAAAKFATLDWVGGALWSAAALTGAGAAAASGGYAIEQLDMANKIDGEIDVRDATQDLNAVTADIQTQGIEELADTLDYVETGLVTEIPDDVEGAESFDTTVPETAETDETQTANNNPFAQNTTENETGNVQNKTKKTQAQNTNTQTGNVQNKSETTNTQNSTNNTQNTTQKKKQQF